MRREKPSTPDDIVIHVEGNSTIIGPRDKHRDLVDALEAYARLSADTYFRELRRLAWFLGENGQVEACRRIMAHAGEEETSLYGYGVFGG